MEHSSLIRIAPCVPETSVSEHKDMAGKTLVHSLSVVLEHSHMLCVIAEISRCVTTIARLPVFRTRLISSSASWYRCSMVSAFSYADRLAVGKIGHDGPDAAILYREPGGVGKEKVAFFYVLLTPPDHPGQSHFPRHGARASPLRSGSRRSHRTGQALSSRPLQARD